MQTVAIGVGRDAPHSNRHAFLPAGTASSMTARSVTTGMRSMGMGAARTADWKRGLCAIQA